MEPTFTKNTVVTISEVGLCTFGLVGAGGPRRPRFFLAAGAALALRPRVEFDTGGHTSIGFRPGP